ncbi:MAG: hypothetical protein BGO78_05845 [Chloroflexi bacterium 44-23]|nr:MAG: hypothetical protein BGO78_05845 [Chloroflexi bacterium 44-23]
MGWLLKGLNQKSKPQIQTKESKKTRKIHLFLDFLLGSKLFKLFLSVAILLDKNSGLINWNGYGYTDQSFLILVLNLPTKCSADRT